MAAVAAAILATKDDGTDLECAYPASFPRGQDLESTILAINTIKRYFLRRKHPIRLDHRRLADRVLFDAELFRGLGRLAIQICIFCFKYQLH